MMKAQAVAIGYPEWQGSFGRMGHMLSPSVPSQAACEIIEVMTSNNQLKIKGEGSILKIILKIIQSKASISSKLAESWFLSLHMIC